MQAEHEAIVLLLLPEEELRGDRQQLILRVTKHRSNPVTV